MQQNNSRRGFIKMLSMATLACALPEPTQRLTLPCITSNADMNIGVERMRITTSGNCLVGTTTDSGARLQMSSTGRYG